MRSHRGVSAASFSSFTRPIAALALAALIGACGTLGGRAVSASPRANLEFDNQTADPVRVYLVVDEGGEYLLGRVYPLQTSTLQLPRHMPITDSRRVALVVVPSGASSFSQRVPRGPFTREFAAPLAELAMQRYVITPTALHGSIAWQRRTP